jgi:glucan phosphoethanolaminetransferase (alkaline phosphatase superfamily)
MTQKPKKPLGVRVYLTLSAFAAIFVAVLVYFGTRNWTQTWIWGGLTFIVVLVAIATMALSVKDDDFDGSTPRLYNKPPKK